jgi:uncharacterized protein (TIGR02453 family)
VTPTPYFTSKTFEFLKELAANNRRDWFAENKARYEDHVKVPALRFIQDFQDGLRRISPHFTAGPRALFRIHRDTRFAKDKSPYKTHTGIHFRHDQAGDVHAPGYYMHIEPGACFVGLGIWHPDGPATRKIREAIVEDPTGWKKATRGKKFADTFEMSGDRLSRAPRGFDPEHPMAEDLKWKDFVGGRSVPQSFLTSPDLPAALAKQLAIGSPFMAFLCKAVEVPF